MAAAEQPQISEIRQTSLGPQRLAAATLLAMASGLAGCAPKNPAPPHAPAPPSSQATSESKPSTVTAVEVPALKDATSELTTQIDQHRELMLGLLREPTEQDVCGALSSALVLAPSLAEHFTQLQQASLTQSAESEWEALESQLQATSRTLPGVRLVMGAEGVHGFVDYPGIAALAPAHSAASRLLQSAGELWSPTNGWPSFVEQQTDLGGCTQLGQLRAAVEPLLAQWPTAPLCLRETLLGPVGEAVRQATSSQCFCTDKPATERDAAALMALLAAPPLHASGMDEALKSSVTASDTRFDCQASQ